MRKVMFMNKKAIILHPVTWTVISFILGFIIATLIARGVIPISIPICTGG